MIENKPSNVSSVFEMLLEEIRVEIDFFKDDFLHGACDISDAGRARLAEGKQT